jgi:uncharacterized protein
MLKKKVFFYGYASVFNVLDENKDIILQNSFLWNKDVIIPVLFEHNPRKKIGQILNILQNKKGLFVEGELEAEYFKKYLKLSVGYVLNNNIVQKNGIRILDSLNLFEISVVNNPANKLALAICV